MIEDYDRLNDADKDLIHALPYRVGLWMSMLDGRGGDQADERESIAMMDVIEQMARSSDWDFASYICRQTLASRDHWGKWSSDFTLVPNECARARGILARVIPDIDLAHFSQMLFLIAASVARAYREKEVPKLTPGTDLDSLVHHLMEHLFDRLGVLEDRENVSKAEADALRQLARLLELDRAEVAECHRVN